MHNEDIFRAIDFIEKLPGSPNCPTFYTTANILLESIPSHLYFTVESKVPRIVSDIDIKTMYR